MENLLFYNDICNIYGNNEVSHVLVSRQLKMTVSLEEIAHFFGNAYTYPIIVLHDMFVLHLHPYIDKSVNINPISFHEWLMEIAFFEVDTIAKSQTDSIFI
jgi:hypothetical protein